MLKYKAHVPHAGIVALTFPGYYLGEEMAPAKYEEILTHLDKLELVQIRVDSVVTNTHSAREAGRELAGKGVDFICAIHTTFVPDHFLVELLDACDVPIFVYAIEREIGCLSLVGAMLNNPTLYDLNKHYQIQAGEIGDKRILEKLMIFARAAMMKRVLSEMRVGYMGKNPDIMFSMQVDEYGLKKILGVTVVPLRDFEYSERVRLISDDEARKDWESVKGEVGSVDVVEADGIEASKGYLAMVKMAGEQRLDALSINCWTHLKSKICLPVARFNDIGIGAGCEGDLHSTILLRLLYVLSGHSAINGDFFRLYPDKNQIMFSHCGAGSFSLASDRKDINIHASIETNDGIGVFFPVEKPGKVTAVNLMGSRAGYRLAVLAGEVSEADRSYEGNPMNVQFEKPVEDILQDAVRYGAGHHWSITYGSYEKEFELLTRFLGIEFHLLS
jgi:L-fucose isomerase-like protein